jgi:putative oxidoreductase
MNKFLSLSFLPTNKDLSLLLLRIMFGGYMLIGHGWGKIMGWSKMSGGFPDPLGVGSAASLGMTIFAEVIMATLLLIGLFSRLSALVLTVTMGVAFFMVHGGALTGEGSGELALAYGVVYLALVFTGAGKYSVDHKMGG